MDKPATGTERVVRACAIFLTALYLVTGLSYLCLDYWPITEQDFWRIYDICLNHSWWHSVIYKFNGHSLFFPSFIWLADLRLFHGDQTIVFAGSLVLLIISTGMLLLPIWQEKEIDDTTKVLATLTIAGVSTWMGRSSITVSGGFNCMNSFVMLGFAWSLLLLPKMESLSQFWWRNSLLLVCAGYVATFSFAIGLAIWPCLLFLGWCRRASWRSLGTVLLGGLSAGAIFRFLPPRTTTSSLIPAGSSIFSLATEYMVDFCRLLGAPVLHCTTALQGVKITAAMTQSSSLLLWSGALSLLLAMVAATLHLIRRDLQTKTLEFVGLALIVFNLLSLSLVVAGRLEYFRVEVAQIAAPRYLFWSSLFWAGLILIALGAGRRHRWLRWPSVLLVLAAPIFGWPAHREEGLHWRYAKLLSEESATALINGVRDPSRPVFRDQRQVDLLEPQLRARRLDMFAAGFQDWIGHSAAQIFRTNDARNHFRGVARAEQMTAGNPAGAARVVGRIYPHRGVPSTMVILDSNNSIVGIARSFPTGKVFNALLFNKRMSPAPLRGYIRQYNPAMDYTLRSVDAGSLSTKEIGIAPSPPKN